MRTMCDISRRNLLLASAAFAQAARADDEINVPVSLIKDVYFHQGDIAHQGHCNNGWIVFKDYVLVIDANFPSGAQNILPKIRAAIMPMAISSGSITAPRRWLTAVFSKR